MIIPGYVIWDDDTGDEIWDDNTGDEIYMGDEMRDMGYGIYRTHLMLSLYPDFC